LYHHLAAVAADAVPAGPLARLHAAFEANVRRNLFLTGELLKLLAAFEAEGIPAIPYKGPVLASTVYGHLALRVFTDLDVIVPRRDVRRAAQVLAAQRYRYLPQAELTRAQQAVFLRFPCALPFARDDGRGLVDLHWDLAPRSFAFRFTPERLRRRLGRARLAGVTVPAIAPEDLLLILCVHNAKHLWERLSWLCDVSELIAGQPELDWDRLLGEARELGVERMVLLGLLLAQELLGAVLPPAVARRARGDRAAVALGREIAADLFRPRAGSLPPFAEMRFCVRARERLRDKARLLVRSALTPTVTEVALLPLPAALAPLYYPLRPLRLAGKLGRSLWR
jgi:hypothetical protein